MSALRLLNLISVPKLTTFELRGDAMTYFALDTKFDALDEDQQSWLEHDWGISDQDGLEMQLFDQETVKEIRALAKKANLVLGGELEAKRVRKTKKLSESRYAEPSPTVAW